MKQTSSGVLRPEVLTQLEEIGRVDLVVGIPSFNNARTIGHVVRAITAGLAKYFPDTRPLLVNSDGGSRDGTTDIVAQEDMQSPARILIARPARRLDKVITAYQGLPGKGSAFRTIFEIAAELMRLGVGPARCYQEVYERNSPAFTRLQGHALADLRLDAGGQVASIRVTLDQ